LKFGCLGWRGLHKPLFLKEKEMPKMKTKSGAKKRFRVTGSGKVKVKQSHMRHMQMNKPKSMKRKAKGQTIMAECDAKIVLDNFMPYDRVKKTKVAAIKAKKVKAAQGQTASKGGK
jgi:large subunit ribosomal protein L35